MAFAVAMPTVWTWLFHQDRAACMKVHAANFTWQSAGHAQIWKTDSVFSNHRVNSMTPSFPAYVFHNLSKVLLSKERPGRRSIGEARPVRHLAFWQPNNLPNMTGLDIVLSKFEAKSELGGAKQAKSKLGCAEQAKSELGGVEQRSGWSKSVPRRGRPDISLSAGFNKTNNCESPMSTRQLRDADISVNRRKPGNRLRNRNQNILHWFGSHCGSYYQELQVYGFGLIWVWSRFYPMLIHKEIIRTKKKIIPIPTPTLHYFTVEPIIPPPNFKY
ncbi:hypothetical protein LXL04_009070 [Taraxacum kok-saghyz]